MKQINWPDHILNFLAVIIGVSLAFYVSSTSEEKKEEEELKQILTSFVNELSLDIETYDNYQIENNEAQSAALGRVIGFLLSGNLDSLGSDFSSVVNVNNYSPVGVTFSSISSSGKLDLIEDFELRKEIANYHEVGAKEALLRGEAQVDFFMNLLTPWLISNISLVNPDVKKLSDNQELVNLLVLYKGFVDNKIRQYREVSKAAENLRGKLTILVDEK